MHNLACEKVKGNFRDQKTQKKIGSENCNLGKQETCSFISAREKPGCR
jgi:hypothetical protein